MSVRASDIPELGFQVGDDVCAFYNRSSDYLNDIVADYVPRGLGAGDKCVCFIDMPSSVRERIPSELVPQDDISQFFIEDERYVPEGDFSKDALRRLRRGCAQGGTCLAAAARVAH